MFLGQTCTHFYENNKNRFHHCHASYIFLHIFRNTFTFLCACVLGTHKKGRHIIIKESKKKTSLKAKETIIFCPIIFTPFFFVFLTSFNVYFFLCSKLLIWFNFMCHAIICCIFQGLCFCNWKRALPVRELFQGINIWQMW